MERDVDSNVTKDNAKRGTDMFCYLSLSDPFFLFLLQSKAVPQAEQASTAGVGGWQGHARGARFWRWGAGWFCKTW